MYNEHSPKQISQKSKWILLGWVGRSAHLLRLALTPSNCYAAQDHEVKVELYSALAHLDKALSILTRKQES